MDFVGVACGVSDVIIGGVPGVTAGGGVEFSAFLSHSPSDATMAAAATVGASTMVGAADIAPFECGPQFRSRVRCAKKCLVTENTAAMFVSQSWIAWAIVLLVVIGALNWGYISYTSNCDDDLVGAVLPPMYTRVVYALVGVAGLIVAASMLFNRGGAIGRKAYSALKSRK